MLDIYLLNYLMTVFPLNCDKGEGTMSVLCTGRYLNAFLAQYILIE